MWYILINFFLNYKIRTILPRNNRCYNILAYILPVSFFFSALISFFNPSFHCRLPSSNICLITRAENNPLPLSQRLSVASYFAVNDPADCLLIVSCIDMCLTGCLPSEWLLGWQVMSLQCSEPLDTCPVAVIMASEQSCMRGAFVPMIRILPQARGWGWPESSLMPLLIARPWRSMLWIFTEKNFCSHTISHTPFILPTPCFTTTRLVGVGIWQEAFPHLGIKKK